METIFDYAPTPEELRYFAGPFSQSDYLHGLSEDEAVKDLCRLFGMRGEAARARVYADRIADRDYVRFTLYNGDLIAPTAAENKDSRASSRSKAA
ncbi:hypothetical protein [uncultured Thiocystis sp.]|jgi:hypothetical protein|uniref:hypothetical protein n=1 Tax=uncultured Thiocystis sp. TaxID=1202134 RepID=UPI0025FADB71|nr:hypothetical protein [uncultured Thiocystis sp.]